MNVNCPHCQQGVENRPDIAGQVVSCPHCVRQFRLPPWQQVIVPEAQHVSQAGQQPVFVVNAPAKQRARLKPKGWFANTLGTAGAFFLCAFLFLVASCGGAWYWVRWNVVSTVEAVSDSIKLTQKQGKSLAEKAIKQYGITELSDNVTVIQLGDDWIVSGVGLDRGGDTHDVIARIQVATFGNKRRTELKSLSIDGKREFP